MIRVLTLDEFEPKQLEKLCKQLYTAFGVGAEHTAMVKLPPEQQEPFDAEKLLAELTSPRVYQDDKLLYVTKGKLADRTLPSGKAPTQGFCFYGKQRALISVNGFKDWEASAKPIGRQALHQLGHLWELHHCLDPRCSMYPPWTPSFVQGDATFCVFCREKSEQKIRLEKS